MKTNTKYDQQAESFLAKHGIKIRITLSDSKSPAWSKDGKRGHHYRVTLHREGWKQDRRKAWEKIGDRPQVVSELPAANRLTFDYWGSIADAEKGREPSAYDVLACLSSDASCADTFKEFCADYGYNQDSITALQTFRRCSTFAKRLRAFFTEAELADLAEIQ